MKTCIACGMPMTKPEDFPLRDESMQSYKEKAASMAAFLVGTQGLDEGAALAQAKAMMASLPAWAGRK